MPIEIKNFEAELLALAPTENNPRQISEKEFESLKNSLVKFPEMKSIREVVIDENGRILGGHMRVKALKELGEKTVPVKQVFGLSEKQKDEFVIRDNVQQGKWDMDILANEWDDLDLQDWGLVDIPSGELDIKDEDFLQDTEITKDKEKTIICPNCGEEFKV